MKLKMFTAVVAIFTALTGFSASAYQSYQVVGEGGMRWFVFQLYQARLLSPDGSYEHGRWPLALQLTYERAIASADLIEATKTEWQRMDVEYAPSWLEELASFWPDVSTDDVLVFHVDEKAVGRFYYNGNLIGSVDDESFGSAFLSIWLSDGSRNQTLRRHLTTVQRPAASTAGQ